MATPKRPWSPEEVKLIHDMAKQGLTPREIAEALPSHEDGFRRNAGQIKIKLLKTKRPE